MIYLEIKFTKAAEASLKTLSEREVRDVMRSIERLKKSKMSNRLDRPTVGVVKIASHKGYILKSSNNLRVLVENQDDDLIVRDVIPKQRAAYLSKYFEGDK